MRKKYPYLEESYVYDLNEEQEKRHILALLDDFVNQRQYVNMILLDWQENPIKEIDGIISSGSLTKDGNSSVRRTCNLSCSVSGGEYNVEDLSMDFSLNKKVFIEIGIKNETDLYPDWPILWFPQGVFYINSFSMNSSTSSAVNLSLQLKDKMCLLNGDVGGILPATVRFDLMTTQLADGSIVEQKVLYYNIITELVHHWGEEDLSNIIIQDVPLRIRRIMQWNGDTPIYLFRDTDNNYQIEIQEPENLDGYTMYEKTDRVGYTYADFVPTSEITGAAGSSVCTILDTIKSQLGNYEYFYDVFGIFHFREIKNYLNIDQSSIILQETGNKGRHVNLKEGQFLLDSGSEIQYLVDTTNEKTLFSFKDSKNLTSINITPNYGNIKNDFIIDGIRNSEKSEYSTPIRFRVAIDNKPEPIGKESDHYIYGEFDNVLYYTYPTFSEDDKIIDEVNKLGYWFDYYEKDTDSEGNEIGEHLTLPNVGNMDQIYRVIEENKNVFYIWSGSSFHRLYLKNAKIQEQQSSNTGNNSEEDDSSSNRQNIISQLENILNVYLFRLEDLINSPLSNQALNNFYEACEPYGNFISMSDIKKFINYNKLTSSQKIKIADSIPYKTVDDLIEYFYQRIEELKTNKEKARGINLIVSYFENRQNEFGITEPQSIKEDCKENNVIFWDWYHWKQKNNNPNKINSLKKKVWTLFRAYPRTLADHYSDIYNYIMLENKSVFSNTVLLLDYLKQVVTNLNTFNDKVQNVKDIEDFIIHPETRIEGKTLINFLLEQLPYYKSQLPSLTENVLEDAGLENKTVWDILMQYYTNTPPSEEILNKIQPKILDAIQGLLGEWEITTTSNISNSYENELELLDPVVYSTTIPNPANNAILGVYKAWDWRTFLYLYGLSANAMGTDPGPYFSDLDAFWPYEYELERETQKFKGELADQEVQYKTLTSGNYFFDIIDANSSSLGEYSVQNIGRRIDVYSDENINCLFEPEIPDVVYLDMDNPDNNWSDNTTITELMTTYDKPLNKLAQQREECVNNNQPFVQVPTDVFMNLSTGSYLSDAYEQIKYELFSHLTYQRVVSITALPIYYLEPNSRVELSDYTTNTYGDFMVQTINLTFGPGANMAVTLNEVAERL